MIETQYFYIAIGIIALLIGILIICLISLNGRETELVIAESDMGLMRNKVATLEHDIKRLNRVIAEKDDRIRRMCSFEND